MPSSTVNTTFRPGTIFIPQAIFEPFFKVEVVRGNGEILNLTTSTISWSVDKNRNRLTAARASFDNGDGSLKSKLTGGDILKIYLDYVDGTTLFFQGKLDEIYYNLNNSQGWSVTLHARHIPELVDKTTTATYSKVAADEVVTSVVNAEYSGLVTLSGLPSGLDIISDEFRHISGVAAFKRILEKVGYNWYIDKDNVLTAFVADSNQNTAEKISFGVNLLSVSGVGVNYKKIKNRVFVYGNKTEDSNSVFYLKTSEDINLQNTLWVNDLIVNDTTLTTNASTEQESIRLLNANNSTAVEGSLRVAGALLTAEPAQSIEVSVPYCNLDGFFRLERISHKYDSSAGVEATVFLSKINSTLGVIFGGIFRSLEEQQDFTNKNQMENGVVFVFDDTSQFGATSNVNFADSKLSLVAGATTGTATSISFPVSSFSLAEWKSSGEQLGSSTIEVSNDGITFLTVGSGELKDLLSASTTLVVRIKLISDATYPNPELTSLGVYIK